MKDEIARFLVEDSGVPLGLIMVLCVVWASYLVYMDRDEYRRWDENTAGNKLFLIVKLFVLLVLTIGAIDFIV